VGADDRPDVSAARRCFAELLAAVELEPDAAAHLGVGDGDTRPKAPLCAYTSHVSWSRRLRPVVAVFLAASFAVLFGAPLCFSDACPMSATERQACRRMGRDCCGNGTGQLSHAPATPSPAVAATSPAATVVPPPLVAVLSKQVPLAPAAIVQGIGLFTLFAVFLI
jgi:hypothetical protein